MTVLRQYIVCYRLLSHFVNVSIYFFFCIHSLNIKDILHDPENIKSTFKDVKIELLYLHRFGFIYFVHKQCPFTFNMKPYDS